MSMLAFMPWCRIERVYEAGDIVMLPFKRHVPIDGADDTGQCLVHTILTAYKTIEGRPVDRAALVRYAGKSLLDDLSKGRQGRYPRARNLVCFCGLAMREYFNALVRIATAIAFLFISKNWTRPTSRPLQHVAGKATRQADGRLTTSPSPSPYIVIRFER